MDNEPIIMDGDSDTLVQFQPSSAEMRLPTSYGEAIEFVARSWWRRTLIKFISGGRIEFFPNG